MGGRALPGRRAASGKLWRKKETGMLEGWKEVQAGHVWRMRHEEI